MVSTSGLSDWLYVKHRRIRSCECSGTMEKEKNQTGSQMTETILEWKRHGDLALTTVQLNVFICGEVRSHFCQTNQHQQILRASWGQNEHAKLNKAVNCRSHQCKYSILHWWDWYMWWVCNYLHHVKKMETYLCLIRYSWLWRELHSPCIDNCIFPKYSLLSLIMTKRTPSKEHLVKHYTSWPNIHLHENEWKS